MIVALGMENRHRNRDKEDAQEKQKVIQPRARRCWSGNSGYKTKREKKAKKDTRAKGEEETWATNVIGTEVVLCTLYSRQSEESRSKGTHVRNGVLG